jgi:hypothetical protein
MEIRSRKQQKSEKIYLQRSERKGHMGVMQQDPETGSPLSQAELQVL